MAKKKKSVAHKKLPTAVLIEGKLRGEEIMMLSRDPADLADPNRALDEIVLMEDAVRHGDLPTDVPVSAKQVEKVVEAAKSRKTTSLGYSRQYASVWGQIFKHRVN